jgi:hypothetical protein
MKILQALQIEVFLGPQLPEGADELLLRCIVRGQGTPHRTNKGRRGR